MNPEHINLFSDLLSENEKEIRPKVYEKDECPVCGNFYEARGSCRACMNDKRKLPGPTETEDEIPKVSDIEEGDKCQNCNNEFYSGGSCPDCADEEVKKQFLKENKEGKQP